MTSPLLQTRLQEHAVKFRRLDGLRVVPGEHGGQHRRYELDARWSQFAATVLKCRRRGYLAALSTQMQIALP